MYRFQPITNLAPLFSALPLSSWLMLVGSTLVAVAFQASKAKPSVVRS